MGRVDHTAKKVGPKEEREGKQTKLPKCEWVSGCKSSPGGSGEYWFHCKSG